MTDDEPQFEIKNLWTLRATEELTKSKWIKQGWEFVRVSEQSLMRTQLEFRRVKARTSWFVWAGLAGALVLIATIVGIGIASETEDPSLVATEVGADATAGQQAETPAQDASNKPPAAESSASQPEPTESVAPGAPTSPPSVAQAEARWLEIMQVDQPIQLVTQDGYDYYAPLHAILPGWSGAMDDYLRIAVQQELSQEEVLRLGINVVNLLGPEYPDLEGVVFTDSKGRDHNFFRGQAPGADLGL